MSSDNALSTVTMFAVNHDSFLSVTLIMKFSSLPQETIETDGTSFSFDVNCKTEQVQSTLQVRNGCNFSDTPRAFSMNLNACGMQPSTSLCCRSNPFLKLPRPGFWKLHFFLAFRWGEDSAAFRGGLWFWREEGFNPVQLEAVLWWWRNLQELNLPFFFLWTSAWAKQVRFVVGFKMIFGMQKETKPTIAMHWIMFVSPGVKDERKLFEPFCDEAKWCFFHWTLDLNDLL